MVTWTELTMADGLKTKCIIPKNWRRIWTSEAILNYDILSRSVKLIMFMYKYIYILYILIECNDDRDHVNTGNYCRLEYLILNYIDTALMIILKPNTHGCMHAYIQTDRQTERQRERERERETERHTDTQTHRHTCTYIYRYIILY